MISPQEIRTVTFDKVMRGYRAEDVDAFLQQVAQDMDQLTAEAEERKEQMLTLAKKIEEYRKEIENYRNDEDNLKTALLNAQRMGENVIREAKQTAEAILREANIRSDTLTRVAREQVEDQQHELERIKAEISRFKKDVLSMYKQHIELLSDLPGDEEAVEEEDAVAQEKAEYAQANTPSNLENAPQQNPVVTESEVGQQGQAENQVLNVVSEQTTTSSPFPDLSEMYAVKEKPTAQTSEVENDTSLNTERYDAEITDNVTVPPSNSVEEPIKVVNEPQSSFQGFKGIKFSD